MSYPVWGSTQQQEHEPAPTPPPHEEEAPVVAYEPELEEPAPAPEPVTEAPAVDTPAEVVVPVPEPAVAEIPVETDQPTEQLVVENVQATPESIVLPPEEPEVEASPSEMREPESVTVDETIPEGRTVDVDLVDHEAVPPPSESPVEEDGEELLEGVEKVYSTNEAAEFFGKSNQWLYWGLRNNIFQYQDGTLIEPIRIGKGKRRRFTLPIIKEIALACYRRGNLKEEDLKVILRKVLIAEHGEAAFDQDDTVE